jgi:hypothetical protein
VGAFSMKAVETSFRNSEKTMKKTEGPRRPVKKR